MELLLVLIIAVLLLRPQDWQRLATTLGKGARLWRYYQGQLHTALLKVEEQTSISQHQDSRENECKKH